MSHTGDELSLAVPRTAFYLGLVRRFVTDVARRAGFGDLAVGEIEIAVDEIATRTMQHSFSDSGLAPRDQILVGARIVDGALEITLRDHGERRSDSDSADEIDLAQLAREYDAGGFEKFAARAFLDEVEFTHRPEVGNELRLVRALPGAPGRETARPAPKARVLVAPEDRRRSAERRSRDPDAPPASARPAPAGPPSPPLPLASGLDPAPKGPIGRLIDLARESPDAPALRQSGGPLREEDEDRADRGPETVLSRSSLLEEVARDAAALRAAGVSAGDRVALLLPNSRELVTLPLALWALAATAVVLSPFYTPAELARCLGDARPAGLIGTSRALAELAASGAELPKTRFWARVDGGGAPAGGAVPLYSGAPLGAPELLDPDPGLPATIHFTYKGLGYPLGAIHTYEHHARAALALWRFFRNSEAHIYLCALPLSHIYALVGCVLSPLYGGSSTAIVRRAKPQNVVRYAKTYGANVICLVPALYRLLAMGVRRVKPSDLAGAHWITGGSYLEPELYEDLERELGVRPFQGYGLTEALIVTASNWEANRPGALGVPIFRDTTIEILGEDGEPLPAGEVGEVAVRSPTVMTGYVGRPEETARFLRDGRMLTGDLGCVDGEGFLHFAGRRRRFAKVAGFMVDLREVEATVRTHPAVETCAVSVEPDDVADELIRAAVTMKPGAEVTVAELLDHCRRHLASYKIPKGFRLLRGARPSGAFAARSQERR